MPGDFLSGSTLLTNFLCMAISFWLAIYLLARSQSNFLAFRAIVALLALAFYFNNASTQLINPSANTEQVRSITVLIALAATHDLTHYLLPHDQRKEKYWLTRGIVLLTVVLIILHFYLPHQVECDPRYHCPVDTFTSWMIFDLFKLLIFFAILNNLWVIRHQQNSFQNRALLLALLLGTCTIGYNLLANILLVNLPRVINNLLILGALVLLSYSVVRYKTLVSMRTTIYDLPITFLAVVSIVGVYLLFAWQMDLSPASIMMIALLAIFTHASYDIVREFLDRIFRRQERLLLRSFRDLTPDATQKISLQRYLKRGLGFLTTCLEANGGFIALRHGDHFEIVASLHSLSAGSLLAYQAFTLDEITQPAYLLADKIAWLVPVYIRNTQIALIGIGQHKNCTPYSEEELFWLEDVAEEFAKVIQNSLEPYPAHRTMLEENLAETAVANAQVLDTQDMPVELSIKLDPELIRCVEIGLRNLNDVSKLGGSSLVELFGIKGLDHIERGKQVQNRLVKVLDKLRPSGAPPSEPLPHEWYSYVILHDAYVEGRLSRDIMSKLYISEGTYFRTRRSAIRGVARALLETRSAT